MMVELIISDIMGESREIAYHKIVLPNPAVARASVRVTDLKIDTYDFPISRQMEFCPAATKYTVFHEETMNLCALVSSFVLPSDSCEGRETSEIE